MEKKNSIPIRSPRDSLGGYVILPRLIDKVRLHASKSLPEEYVENLLKPGSTLDGRFLSFTGVDGEKLREVILSDDSEEAVLNWINKHAQPHTDQEKQQWAEVIDTYRPDASLGAYRKRIYPDLASRIDVVNISVLDLIDMDEGRIPVLSQ